MPAIDKRHVSISSTSLRGNNLVSSFILETKKLVVIERFFGSIGYFIGRIKGPVAQ